MEVVVPHVNNPMDNFDFTSSAYATAPMTPKFMDAGDCYFSAPPSPTRITEIHHDHDHDQFDDEFFISEEDVHGANSLAITVPFAWEVKPGVPKSYDFTFDVSGELRPDSEHLFQGKKKKEMKTSMGSERERGRERGSSSSSSSSGGLSSSRSRRTRSLPPVIRGLDQGQVAVNMIPPSNCTTLSASGSGKGSKKWSFKDLFLFRSASDGRAMDRDPLKKYSAQFRKHDEDLRNSSMRSDRSGSGSVSKRRGRVSAHELHYTVNRAVSNDMKKKTFLPYKQGILGRLAFNPTVHALANGFGNSNKSIEYQ